MSKSAFPVRRIGEAGRRDRPDGTTGKVGGTIVRYLLLIYGNEAAGAQMTEAEQEAEMGAWFAYTDELRNAGTLLAGEALQPTATATTVRGNAGQTLTSDGPFAETKEQLGGFYLIEAADLDEAAAWAAKMPHFRQGGAVEIRPVIEFASA
jgi:hypothetical protein